MMKAVKLLSAVLLCQAAGIIGSLFTAPRIPDWYAGLRKPSFTPPSWVFGPVWISLFLLMGLSLYIVWERHSAVSKRPAIILFGIQLVLNILWSALFFGARSPSLAFIEIIVLWLAILFTLLAFSKISTVAALLLVPYLLWVSFAAVLNFSLWKLNP